MEKDLKKYEIGFLLLEENDIEEVKKLLSAYKAEILNEKNPQKIRLAYPIKKETSAFFGFIHFSISPDSLKNITNQLKLNKKILRVLIINLPKESKEPKKEKFIESRPEKPVPKAKIKTYTEEPLRKSSSVEAVDTELLEKKLEEILK